MCFDISDDPVIMANQDHDSLFFLFHFPFNVENKPDDYGGTIRL